MRLTPRHRMKCLLAGKGPSHAEVCPETPETGSLLPAFPYPASQGQPLNRVLSNGAFTFLPAIGLCRIPATARLFLTSIPGFGGD